MSPAAASAAPTKGRALAIVRFCAQMLQSRRPPSVVTEGRSAQSSQSRFIIGVYYIGHAGVSLAGKAHGSAVKTTVTETLTLTLD